MIKMIAAHERAISAICWNPEDDNLLASCSVSGRIAIWDVDKEEELYACKIPEVPLLMDWAPAGDKLVLAVEGGDVKLWEYKTLPDKQTKLFSVGKDTVKVLRWHPVNATKLLMGSSDGSLAVYDQAVGKKLSITGKAKTSKDPVSDAQWDPLSEEYFLAAFQDGSLALFDVSAQKEVHQFERQAQGIRCLAWAKSQPGNFITCTDRVGVLRLWNVSQRQPLKQIKVGNAGVNCIKAVPNHPNWFVLSFKNSAVGVCDIELRTMRFTTSPGHSETIFDVVFHPDDIDLLATASYDGHVKLWRISTGASDREMYAGKDQLLYGLSFGPSAQQICAVSSTGFLFIWRTDNSIQQLRQQVHTGQAYRVEWNLRNGTEIATGGADGFACVTDCTNGTVVRRIQHSGPVIGVAWHPSQDGILATASQDGCVRIFSFSDVPPGTEPQAQVVLRGHEARVFNLAFHPICPGLLASGSDDKTIRVWNWNNMGSESREFRRLQGHTNYVRGLLWHSEMPNILFSGSWDATIRVWDIATQRCLHVAYEHHADVYGLTLHPQRPFFLVSSSRDTTLRFWIFEDTVRPLLVHAAVWPDRIGEILGSGPDEAMASLNSPSGSMAQATSIKLYGMASRQLVASLQQPMHEKKILQVYQRIISFFMYRTGIEDLWGLLAIIRGEPSVGASSSRTVFHEQELIQCQKSKALELASQRMTIGVLGKQEDRLMKAAQLMLRIGELRSYCRYMAQAGHWERAICIAPAVSRQFWQELCAEYVETLSASTDIDEVAPFWVASGQNTRLADTLVDRGELDSAFVVTKADCDGLLPTRDVLSIGADAEKTPPLRNDRSKLEDVASVLSKRYSLVCEPVQAAMCHLAVSNQSRALSGLSRAHEVVLAYVVAELLGQPKDPIVLKLLAHCAEKDNRWDLAASILRQHPRAEVHLPLLAARAPDKVAAQAWSAWTAQEHQDHLAKALAEGNHAVAVLSSVCLSDRAQAAQVGVQGLHALFSRPCGWSIAEARAILDPLESLPLQDMSVKDIAGVLSCAAYVGLVEASFLGYHELMFPLAQTLRNIITHQHLDFPVSVPEITLLEATSTSHRMPHHALQLLTAPVSGLLNMPDLPPHLRPVCEQHVASIQAWIGQESLQWNAQDGPGIEKLSGGHLPSCYKRYAKTSVLTNQLIKGPAFELEDRKLHISFADALAWTRVNAFSPLNTGCKIYPV